MGGGGCALRLSARALSRCLFFLFARVGCAEDTLFVLHRMNVFATDELNRLITPLQTSNHVFFSPHWTQVTIDQVIGGARGIKSMIWETSNLDADEVSLGACCVAGGLTRH